MKVYRLSMVLKHNGKGVCVYHVAETEVTARKFFEEEFGRFNELVKITDVSGTKTGKKVLSVV